MTLDWLVYVLGVVAVYIVEPIIIYDYKPNGELVDEDTKEILTSILETTQRLNTYNCTKALLEQL